MVQPEMAAEGCKLISNMIFKNGRKVGRLDAGCTVTVAGRDVTVAWPSGICCTAALPNAREAKSFAGQCRAAIGGIEEKTRVSSLTLAAPKVADLAGRLAQFLYDEALRSETLDSGVKRRRLEQDPSLFSLVQCSKTTLRDVILGVKERRGLLDGTAALGFHPIVEGLRDRFPREWRRMRALQISSTNEEDRKVAKAVILRHLSYDLSTPTVSTSPKK